MKKLLSTAIVLYETEALWRNLLIVTIVLTLAYWLVAPSPPSLIASSSNMAAPTASFTPSHNIKITPSLKEQPNIIPSEDRHAVKLPDPKNEATYPPETTRIVIEKRH